MELGLALISLSLLLSICVSFPDLQRGEDTSICEWRGREGRRRGEGRERRGEGERTVSLIVCLEYEWENTAMYLCNFSQISSLREKKTRLVLVASQKSVKKMWMLSDHGGFSLRRKARHPDFMFLVGKNLSKRRVSRFLHFSRKTNRSP